MRLFPRRLKAVHCTVIAAVALASCTNERSYVLETTHLSRVEINRSHEEMFHGRINYNSSVHEVVALLTVMPDWVEISAEVDCSEQRLIERIMVSVSQYELDDIRSAIKAYVQKEVSHESLDKVFLLNKYIFALPATTSTKSDYNTLAAGLYMPVLEADQEVAMGLPYSRSKDEVDVRWPWSEDSEGNWRLTGRAQIRGEAIYYGLAHFDYHRRIFKRRKPKPIDRD